MIKVTRLNGTIISINPFIIEMMEETPDTVIQFNSGRKIVVKDKIAQIRDKTSDFLAEAIYKGIKKSNEG